MSLQRADSPESLESRAAQPGFAERHGPTVLLAIGVVLVLAGLAGAFASQQIAASTMFTTGVVAVVAGTVLSRMEGRFKVLFISGSLTRTRDRAG